ncbi:hypothetical protein DPMN_168455 [Dreissena polymorpha]|uniref:Uncharacterized protein n=1 Tax=Dreissena polymorpha TaxID=45954 RepID=A0A9D4F3D1_DREPO|nr:hypothetical protein DPMN_168455 [Dreissena polymorpha]
MATQWQRPFPHHHYKLPHSHPVPLKPVFVREHCPIKRIPSSPTTIRRDHMPHVRFPYHRHTKAHATPHPLTSIS